MINKLERSQDNIVGFEASGTVSEEEHQQMYGEMRSRIDRYGRIRVLGKLHDFPKIDPAAIDDRIAFAREHLEDIERAALVTDSTTAAGIAQVMDKLTGVDIRMFDMEEEDAAWEWLTS